MSAGEQTYYNIKRLHVVFAASAVALLGVTLWALAVDSRRPWKQYQRTFHEQIEHAPHTPGWQPRVEQVSLADLSDCHLGQPGRVDRCTTCHLGIDKTVAGRPAEAAYRAEQQPYRSHPRLDLFVGEGSPHPLSRFGCTVCHEGQGSATDFSWASHSPNDAEQQARWRQQYGWACNPHWDFPMLRARFAESRCASCHHEITDLESSRRFPDPPAAKLLAGYNLVRQLGCFGCHEIRGTDDDGRQIGPDMRPQRQPLGKSAGGSGTLLKVGPSLRHVAEKVDAAYLADRIGNPARFLPSTRMPRIYGLHEHLRGENVAVAERLEEGEIRAITAYLLARSEPRPPLPTPIDAVKLKPPSAARGKRLFETQGCLACHRHDDFPQGTATQGPDLSHVGGKYRPTSGVEWLVSWIRKPAYYRLRTAMPMTVLKAEESTTDPAADIAAYLLQSGGRVEKASEPAVPTKTLVDTGRAAIATRGCCGCHDIPGFENAQQIGPALSSWGRKQESLLQFGRVDELIAESPADMAGEEFFVDALRLHHREGFLWQKLRSPRSFDFGIAHDNDASQPLTMGRFNLTDRQREAIMTFVLGLVAEPPGDKYVCRAEGRRGAIAEGRKVLDKYACAECHTLELERWTLANAAGGRGTELVGTPRVDASGKLLEDEDDAGQPLNFFTPWEPAVIDGRSWPVGGADVPVGRSQLLARHPPLGGTLARLLYPVLLARAKASGATGTESEVWGWTPPPLVHEGAKVQAAWLRDYLANPAAIRPAAALRMPRFNFSEAEIAKLVAYFAADSEEKTVGLAAGLPTGTLDPPYNAAKTAGDSGTEETPLRLARWQSAMKILTDQKTFCARCHLIGEQPGSGGGFVATAPNLEEVGHRIQPEYIRRWLANPRSILPYTTMPVNFPPASPPLGKVAGLDGSDDQLDAVVDLLIHYDRYLRRQRRP